MVFDAPKIKSPFRLRYKKFKDAIEKLNTKHVKAVEHETCKSKEHLAEWMDNITNNGGEGVMLRDPESKYEGKRTDKLLKVKKFEDAEATVIGH